MKLQFDANQDYQLEANEVWLHDLNSTIGTYLDGVQVYGKQPLMGVHDVKLGRTSLRVWSRADLVA